MGGLKNKKGIVIETWVYIVLAILSVSLLLLLFLGRAPESFERVFCGVLGKIRIFSSSGVNLESCGDAPRGFNDEVIEVEDREEAIEELLAYVVLCWKRNGGEGSVRKDDLCFNVFLNNIAEEDAIICEELEDKLAEIEEGKYVNLVDGITENGELICENNDRNRGFWRRKSAIVRYSAGERDINGDEGVELK